MTAESFEIILHHIMIFVKICLVVIILRALLYALGVTYHIPVLDDLSHPLMPYAETFVDGMKTTWEMLQNFYYNVSS